MTHRMIETLGLETAEAQVVTTENEVIAAVKALNQAQARVIQAHRNNALALLLREQVLQRVLGR